MICVENVKHKMNIHPADNNDMLLLMNGSLDQFNKSQEPNQQYIHLAPSNEQYLVQTHSTMDLESLGDLLNGQPIAFEDGELSMIHKDGQQYIVLPSVSMGQVLQTTEVITTDTRVEMPINNQYDQAIDYSTQPVESVGEDNIEMATGDDQQATDQQMTQENNPEAETAAQSNSALQTEGAAPVGSKPDHNAMDITQLIPSLYQDATAAKTGETQKLQLQCNFCNFVADTDVDLDDHMEQHRNEMTEELYKGCKESFSKKSPKKGKKGRRKKNTCKFIRTGPLPVVKRKGPFTCPVCSAQIEKVNAYRRHIKEHSNEKAFKCDKCPEMYNIESNLVLHQAIHADKGEDGSYKCPACQRTFMRIASLKSHLPVHFIDETMICTECGDEFTLKSQLESHMAQHRRDLQRHLSDRTVIISPTGEQMAAPSDQFSIKRKLHRKDLKCPFCHKEFRKECQLKRHILIHTGEKPFACNLCNKAFNQKSALQIHLMMHSGKKPYPCPHCPQLYTQRGNLRMHMARVHTKLDNCFHCDACSCVFKKVGNLNAHITKYHQNMDLEEDDILQNQQNLLTMLTDDMITASKEKSGNKEDMDVIQQLLRSLDEGESSTPDTMSVANSENLLNGDLDNDIVQQALQDSGVDPSNRAAAATQESNDTSAPDDPNNDDEEIFSSQSDLNDDIIIVQTSGASEEPTTSTEPEPEPEFSQVVNKQRRSVISGVYLRNSGLTGERPWKVRNVNGTRWHQCMYCPKEFKKPSDLIRHIRTHTQERPFKCTHCQKSFAVKTSLTAHERTHLGYKAFKCQVCLKSFSTSGSLKVHLRLHTGARPFKCNLCNMSFRTTGHRYNHIMSHLRGKAHKRPHRRDKKDLLPIFAPSNHQAPMQQPILLVGENSIGSGTTSTTVATTTMPSTGQLLGLPSSSSARGDADEGSERPYKCITCHKSFKKSCHLKQHIRTHTGEKPYYCTQCGKNFVSASVLKAHLTTHTGVKAFQCMICGQAFSSNNTLKRHITIHSDVRPYMCPYCQKTFKTSSTCKKHIETHRADISVTKITSAAETRSTEPDAVPSFSAVDSVDLFQMTNGQENLGEEGPVYHSHRDDDEQVERSLAVMTNDDDDDVEFSGDNPALQQVNPNVIQNMNNVVGFSGDDSLDQPTTSQSEIIQPQREDMNPNHYSVGRSVGELLRCSGCSSYFTTELEMNEHNEAEQCALSRPFSCSQCCHCLESQEALVSHMLSHDNPRKVSCPQCFVYFNSKSALNRHKENHLIMAKKTCAVCDRIFEDPKELQEHVRQHPDSEVLEAVRRKELLRKAGKRKRTGFYLLSNEQSEILEKTEPKQTMTLSEKILLKAVAEKDKVSLIQTSNQRGRFKEFERDGPLHPNACSYCPKSFRKPSDLARHTRTHTGVKPFKCNVCDKAFTVKSTLVCHLRSHLQRKVFRCHICDMMYAAKSSLKVHMRLHTGAKPYKCPHCSMTFRTSGHRKNHMTVHLVYPNKAKAADSQGEQGSEETSRNAGQTAAARASVAPLADTQPASLQPSVQLTTATSTQPTVVWPDVTLTLPVESFLNTSLFQEGESSSVPVQLHGHSLQLTNEDPNITLQIDPVLLQQTIQESQQHPQQLVPAVSAHSAGQSGSWPAPNVVIQPINNLCVQSVNQAASSSQAQPGDDQQRQLPEINIAVPSSLAGITQQILQQSPVVLTDGNGVEEMSKNSDQALSLNNPSLIQAVQQLISNIATSGASPNQQPTTYRLQALDGNGNGPELTLTLNSGDILTNQTQFAVQSDHILPQGPGPSASSCSSDVTSYAAASSDASVQMESSDRAEIRIPPPSARR